MECTCAALRKASRRLSQAYDAALAPEGLTTCQFSLLSTLGRWAGEPPNIQALAEALALDRTTLGHNLRPLERAGLVAVRADAGDGRVRRVRLTEAGRAKREACVPLWRGAQERFDHAFGAARSAALRAELSAIVHGAPDVR